MSDVIKQLYNGTIRPFDEIHEPTPEREAAIQKYRAAEQHFIELHPECEHDLEVMLSEYAELEAIRHTSSLRWDSEQGRS